MALLLVQIKVSLSFSHILGHLIRTPLSLEAKKTNGASN